MSFSGCSRSRLLAAVVQSGQDFQFGSVKCKSGSTCQDNGAMSKYVNSTQVQPGKPKPKGEPKTKEDLGIFSHFDTPPNLLRPECVDFLSSSIQNRTMAFSTSSGAIEIDCGSPKLPRLDQNLDAAIMASIVESNRSCMDKGLASTVAQKSYNDDIEKAIAMSLKDQ